MDIGGDSFEAASIAELAEAAKAAGVLLFSEKLLKVALDMLALDCRRLELATEETGKVTTLNSTGYNMIANMERNLSQIEYDKKTGLITSIPTTSTDAGYGHDYIKNPLPSVPISMTASEAYKLLEKNLNGLEPDGTYVKHKDYIGAVASIDAHFTQDQFNALVGLRYNIGNLGV